MVSFTSSLPSDDVVSYWNLDQLIDPVTDVVGSNNGTNNGAIPGEDGIIDLAYDFNNNDFIEVNSLATDIQSNTEGTISLWVNFSSQGGSKRIFSASDSGDPSSFMDLYATSAGKITFAIFENSVAQLNFNTDNLYNDSDWHYVVVTVNSSGNQLYIDGSPVARSFTTGTSATQSWFNTVTNIDKVYIGDRGWSTSLGFDGLIDEVGIWNRSISQTEVTTIHNSGIGLTYPFITDIVTINLISPLNDTTIADIGTNFMVSGDVLEDFNTTNLTYYIWNNDSSLHNKTTILLNPEQSFDETLFIDEFILNRDYIWNAEICYENTTFSNCTFSENNFTFNINVFEQISFSYDLEITEGALNSINSSISIFPGNTLTSSILEYNGTNYTTSLIFSEGFYNIVSSIVVPTVNIDTNFTFKFWYLIDGVYYESEENNQTVLNTLFGICGGVSNDSLFNLFLVDEASSISLIGDIEISAEIVSMSSNEVVGSLNNSFSSVDNVSICFTPPSVYSLYSLNAEIKYSSDGYAAEFYFIQNSDLTNFPSNITLYDLNLTDSTEFLITYKNNNFITVEGAIIQLQRRFIGEDVSKVVEAPITADGGKAIVHIDLNTNQYSASIVKDGVVLDFFADIVFSCDNELSGDCQKSLDGRVNPNNDIPIEELTDFSYSISVNEDDQTITVLFASPSGTPASINVLLNQIDTFGNLTSCNTTVITSAGSITCDYTDSIESNILELSISKNGVQLAVASYANNPELDMDGINFFIMFLFMISLVGMAIASPEWMLIISVMVLMIGGTLMLVSGMNLVIGLGALAWLVVAIGIMIFKMAKQEDR